MRVRVILIGWLLQACSGAYGPDVPPGTTAPAARDADVDDAGGPPSAEPRDAEVDAFFINDDPLPICGPDGGMTAPPAIEGTADCPADKNRQGCGCPKPGMQAACWPGRRENRNHGSCVDGTTTCFGTVEFGAFWGPCEGYVLPREDALSGPDACGCFSNGAWKLANLVPCISTNTDGAYVYSSKLDPQQGFACDSLPDPASSTALPDWTSSTLEVECAGQFKLCYALKAGVASDPKPEDCTLMTSCVEAWYGRAGEAQSLPNLPGWASMDGACGQRFLDVGGYGEMSVHGLSAECDPVDDGHGEPYVFHRHAYCSPRCSETPDAEACKVCAVSGSGSF